MKRCIFLLFLFAAPLLPAQTLTALTYNIRFDNPADGDDAWPKRRDFLAAQIRFNAPDVFGIQEGLLRQLVYLDSAFADYARVGVGRDDGKEGGEYSAFYFRRDRFRVLASGTFWLSETPNVPSRGWDAALNRVCSYACLFDSLSSRPFWVFNTHFDHMGQEARRHSAELILKKVKELNPGGFPVIVMGDFNSKPADAPVQTILKEMSDTESISQELSFGPAGTFNGFKFHEPVTERIDYIFLGGKGLKVLQHAVLSDNRNCHYPSDHLPVLARLEWE